LSNVPPFEFVMFAVRIIDETVEGEITAFF
jgi:hypothetical protein